jgi:hypothetical protein
MGGSDQSGAALSAVSGYTLTALRTTDEVLCSDGELNAALLYFRMLGELNHVVRNKA